MTAGLTIFGGAGTDTLLGGKGNDSLWGRDGADTLIGGAGNDTLFGQDGDDTLLGGDGDDRLLAGAGTDWIDGGPGSDRLTYAGTRVDVVVNLATGRARTDLGHATFTGIERATGGAGDDTLIGDGGANRLLGGPGADTLKGNDGDDFLNGNAGGDLLIGGQGADTAKGNDGADTLRMNQPGHGGDLVVGFASGTDRFEFATAAFGGQPGALPADHFHALDAATVYDGANAGTVATTNVYVFDLDADGDGGVLYFDADTTTAGYTVVATLDTGAVAAGDVELI
ncbi:MAG: calcium-binding protein [Alphaproteobacteria bacterium]